MGFYLPIYHSVVHLQVVLCVLFPLTENRYLFNVNVKSFLIKMRNGENFKIVWFNVMFIKSRVITKTVL